MPTDVTKSSPAEPTPQRASTQRRRSLLRRKRDGDEDEIDFTPMIDVTFLLLIYFCVRDVNESGAKLKLPMATNGVAVSELQSVVFTVAASEGGVPPVYLGDGSDSSQALPDGEAEREERIESAVQAGIEEGKEDVIIQADRGVIFREVNKLIKSVSRANAKQLHLAVLDED